MRYRIAFFILVAALTACSPAAPTAVTTEASPPVAPTPFPSPAATEITLPTIMPTFTEIVPPTNTPLPALLPPSALAILPLPKGFEYEYAPESLAFSPGGKRLASGTLAGVVTIWDVAAQKMIHSMWRRPDLVYSVAYSPDGQFLASGDGEGLIQIWSADGALLFTLEGHTNSVTDLAWSPDHSRLYSLSYDNTIRIWDIANRKEALSLSESFTPNGGASLMSLSLSPDGTILATAMFDKTVDIRDPATAEILQTLPPFSDRVDLVLFSPDGSRLFVRTLDGQMTMLVTSAWESVWSVSGLKGLFRMAWSPDGRFLATGTLNESLTIWDAENGNLLHALNVSGVRDLAWSPDGSILAVAHVDGIHLWATQLEPTK